MVRKLKLKIYIFTHQNILQDNCPETASPNDDCSSSPCKCGRKGGLTCQNNICK